MSKSNVKNIISLFFGKHFSKARKVLFGRWLLLSNDSEEKDIILQELWDENPSQITLSTYHDWKRVQQAIDTFQLNKPIKSQISWQKYAAVAVLLIMAMAIPAILFSNKASRENIEMAEVFVPYGESKEVILPDGSKAWINAGSLLVYPKNFDKVDSRAVYLNGEASFDVTKNKEKAFIVKTAYLDVEALGTVFSVQAYASDKFTSATLEEGSIRVDVKSDNGGSSVLKENEQLVYSHLDQSISLSAIDISVLSKTREGYQIFEDATFADIIKLLERKHDVVIHYNAQKYATNNYNVKFSPNESIEDALSVLKHLANIKYEIDGRVIYIN